MDGVVIRIVDDQCRYRPYGEYMTKILALIPARGGSKGIPRKNIRSLQAIR